TGRSQCLGLARRQTSGTRHRERPLTASGHHNRTRDPVTSPPLPSQTGSRAAEPPPRLGRNFFVVPICLLARLDAKLFLQVMCLAEGGLGVLLKKAGRSKNSMSCLRNKPARISPRNVAPQRSKSLANTGGISSRVLFETRCGTFAADLASGVR